MQRAFEWNIKKKNWTISSGEEKRKSKPVDCMWYFSFVRWFFSLLSVVISSNSATKFICIQIKREPTNVESAILKRNKWSKFFIKIFFYFRIVSKETHLSNVVIQTQYSFFNRMQIAKWKEKKRFENKLSIIELLIL